MNGSIQLGIPKDRLMQLVQQSISDRRVLGLIQKYLDQEIVDSREQSFAFLGYSFRGHLRFPREKSHAKLQTRLRELTPRKSGESLQCTIQKLNSTLRGWFGYFRHCNPQVFSAIDPRVRVRLRRLLLKRHRLNPRRLCRNWRWPNAFFSTNGLYGLSKAHAEACQSPGG